MTRQWIKLYQPLLVMTALFMGNSLFAMDDEDLIFPMDEEPNAVISIKKSPIIKENISSSQPRPTTGFSKLSPHFLTMSFHKEECIRQRLTPFQPILEPWIEEIYSSTDQKKLGVFTDFVGNLNESQWGHFAKFLEKLGTNVLYTPIELNKFLENLPGFNPIQLNYVLPFLSQLKNEDDLINIIRESKQK